MLFSLKFDFACEQNDDINCKVLSFACSIIRLKQTFRWARYQEVPCSIWRKIFHFFNKTLGLCPSLNILAPLSVWLWHPDLMEYKLVLKCDQYWRMNYHMEFLELFIQAFIQEITAAFVWSFLEMTVQLCFQSHKNLWTWWTCSKIFSLFLGCFIAVLFVKEVWWTTDELPLNIFLFPSVGRKLMLQNSATVVQAPSNLLSHYKQLPKQQHLF